MHCVCLGVSAAVTVALAVVHIAAKNDLWFTRIVTILHTRTKQTNLEGIFCVLWVTQTDMYLCKLHFAHLPFNRQQLNISTWINCMEQIKCMWLSE